MALELKQQILFKLESIEGIDAVPGASDAIQVFDPSMAGNPDIEDRRPAGGSLSRGFEPVGRNDQTIEFRSDFRGNLDTSIPVDPPEWGQLIEAAGFKPATLFKLTIGATSLGSGFQPGEIVRQSASIRAVVLAAFSSANAIKTVADTSGDYLVVAVLQGTFTAATTTGDSSLTSSLLSAAAAYAGAGYQANSAQELSLDLAAWSGSTPSIGEILGVYDATGVGGQRVGDVMVIRDRGTGGTMEDIDVALLWRDPYVSANWSSYELRNAARDSEALVSAAPVQLRGKSGSCYRNKDGRLKKLLGSRANFTLAGDAGKPMQFTWTLSGSPAAPVNTPIIATSDLGTVAPPRLIGSRCLYGIGADVMAIPTKSVSLAMNQSPTPNLDANSIGGATGSNITERDPAITVVVDDTLGGADFEAARDGATPVRFASVLGSTPGNIMVIVAPRCQAKVADETNENNIAGLSVSLHPRYIDASGDDELYIAQL